MMIDGGVGASIAAQWLRSAAVDPLVAGIAAKEPKSNPAPSGGGVSTTRDYSHMTSREMQGVAQELFAAGKIDLTQLFMLQNAGVPLGKVGPDGEFTPLSESERAAYQNVPLNYEKIAQEAISNLEKTGQSTDPKSGYSAWKGILTALRQSSLGVDAYA